MNHVVPCFRVHMCTVNPVFVRTDRDVAHTWDTAGRMRRRMYARRAICSESQTIARTTAPSQGVVQV